MTAPTATPEPTVTPEEHDAPAAESPDAPPEPAVVPAPTSPGTELLLHHDVPARLSERIALAEASYQSNVVPSHLRSVAGQLNAQAAAIALRLPVWTVQQNMHLIEGRVGWDATFIRAMVRRAGHRIRITERTAERAEVTIWRRPEPGEEPEEPYTGEFTFQDAVDAELIVIDPKTGKPKRDNWRKYVKAMLVARATTIAVRECCPEVMLGNAYSPDELGGDVLDEEGSVIRLTSERVPAEPTRVTEHAPYDSEVEAKRAQWRHDVEHAPTTARVDQLYAEASRMKILPSALYEDGTTVEAALAARRATIVQEAEVVAVEEVHDAELVVDDSAVPLVGEVMDALPADDDEPVADPPELCKNTAARRGIIAALGDGGPDVDGLIDVEFGVPIDQVSTRRLRALAIRLGRTQ